MSYTLGGVAIKAPQTMTENNNTQIAQVRTIAGSVRRDLFGANKRVWVMNYSNMTQADYALLNTQYQLYLANGSTQAFVVTEANYSITANVHIDLPTRAFNTQGTDYISDFAMTLVEA